MSIPFAELLCLPELDLAETPFARILRAASAERRTLAARFRNGLVDKTVIFEVGVPVDCRSNMVQDTLSRFMVRQGRLTREEETQLLQRAAREGRLFGEVVRDAGVATAEEIYRILQQNLAKKLLDLFTWEEGSVTLFDQPPEVLSPLKVNVAQLVLTGCTRFVPKTEVDLAVGHLVGQRIVMHPRPPFDPGALHFSTPQRDLVGVLQSPAGLSDLTSGSSLSFEDTTRFVYGLIVLDLVIPEEDLEAAREADPVESELLAPLAPEILGEPTPPGPPEVEAAPAASSPAAPLLPVQPAEPTAEQAMDIARMAEDVMSTYLRHRRVDARGLLGLTPGASPRAIKEQFLAFCRRFAPWRFDDPRLLPLADKAKTLFFAGWVAYRELGGTGGSLRSGREEAGDGPDPSTLRSSGQMIRRTADELAPQSVELLDPEEHFQKGLAFVRSGEFTKALNALEIAVKCDPQNGTYRAEAAWAFYQRSPGTGAEKAREMLEKALRVEPGCGLALFYYGEMSRLLGEYDVAEEFLRRSIKPMAPDRRPIDKLRDLMKIRKKAGDG